MSQPVCTIIGAGEGLGRYRFRIEATHRSTVKHHIKDIHSLSLLSNDYHLDVLI